MMAMTGRERIGNILHRQPVDRIGLFEHFWGATARDWREQGHIPAGESFDDHFGFDLALCGGVNTIVDLDFTAQVLEETDETRVVLDGNYATMRQHKLHDSTPEHLGFRVTERRTWEELAKPKLVAEARRIDFAGYRNARQKAADEGRFFCFCAAHVFEHMKSLAGHEHMLIGMADDPDWVRDMSETYTKLLVDCQEMLFDQEGWPDGVWYYEDMGFKNRPFMSPSMYNAIVQPSHKWSVQFAKSHGAPVIMHSCGYVEPLLPGMVDAGIDCLQVIEVKAGMDLVKLYRDWGDRLSFMGGIDVRALYSNDLAQVNAELEAKIPIVMQQYGYVLHSDHSIPDTVEYATYRHFVDRGRELGTY